MPRPFARPARDDSGGAPRLNTKVIAARRGWRGPAAGRAAHVDTGAVYLGTTVEVAGLFPFMQASGLPAEGVPVGPDLMTHEMVCLDPPGWVGRLTNNPSIWVQGQPGVGKALDVDTPVATPSGWSRMGDLRPGDQVFDEIGRPAPIVATSPVWTGRPCFEVVFSDGSALVADAEHLWVTETVADRLRRHTARSRPAQRCTVGTPAELAALRTARATTAPGSTTCIAELARELGWTAGGRGWDVERMYRWTRDLAAAGRGPGNRRVLDRGEVLERLIERMSTSAHDQRDRIQPKAPVTTIQIAETLKAANGKLNHAVPICHPLQTPRVDLPIAPYVLGAWLGDGHTDADRITTATARFCARCGAALARSSTGDSCWSCWTTGTLHGQLGKLGVLGNKHIPAPYLRAAPEQRRTLLAGLLDTDGTVSPGGQVQVTTINRRLADQVYELVCSLGMRPTRRQGRARLDGRDCGTVWTIGFTTTEPVFRLPRKGAALQQRTRRRASVSSARTRLRYIVAVRPVQSRPVRCIQIAAASGLYLAGRSFIATHNSAITKRLCLGLVGYGHTMLCPGDVKGEYAGLVRALGGQVVRVGRGLDRINPLDSGPLGRMLTRLPAKERQRLTAEVNARRAELLHALLATTHGLGRRPIAEESTALHTAVRLAAAPDPAVDPTIPEVIKVLRTAPEELLARVMARGDNDYLTIARGIIASLENLCDGPLAGLFDAPTTTPLDLEAPAISVDLSAILTAGDHVVAAGLLATWAYSYAAVDTARAFNAMHRPVVLPLDELWRALRAGPGMVEAFDTITRLNRAKGEISLMITHSLRDLEALPTEEDRAKAAGLMERCDTLILAAMPMSELMRISKARPLTDNERQLVSSWAAPSTTGLDGTDQVHPGRGKYLIKIGQRIGIPTRLQLTPAERPLYDTDTAMRRQGAAP